MGNPQPQPTPTSGKGTAAYVQVSGTNVGNCSQPVGGTGQGAGAIPSGVLPVAQYALTLSLASKTINGVAYHNTCQLTTVIKDAVNATFTGTNSPVYKSYADPVGAFYNPSPFVPPAGSPAYNGIIASVSGSGLITGLAVGQCTIEVQFSTFDDVQTPATNTGTGNPWAMIYAQINVNVVP
jgi:hypothetical protein